MNKDTDSLVNLNYIPQTSAVHFGFRQKLESQVLNALHGDILEDLLDLFNHANEFREELNYVNHTVTAENIFLRYRLNQLEAKLKTLSELYTQASENQVYRKRLIFPNEIRNNEEEHEMEIDLSAMCLTMKPTRYISKVNVYDESLDTTYVPSSLQFLYGSSTTQEGYEVLQIEDNGPQHAFDDNPTSCWVRRYICNRSASEVQCELIVSLPDDIVTNKRINQIKINPYPVDAVDILSVEFKTNGDWMMIPGFENHHRSTSEWFEDFYGNQSEEGFICNAPCLRFNFKDLTANQLRIRFRQQNFIQREPGTREFLIGAKSIEVGYATYHNQYYTFEADVVFPETEQTIVVEQIETIYTNSEDEQSAFSDPQIECFWYDEYNKLHLIHQTVPFTLNRHKMLIKFKMFEELTTPNIRQINVHYQV